MKNNYIHHITVFFVVTILCACSRNTVLIDNFDVQSGAFLKLPVNHTTFPYPQTNIYFDLNNPIVGHLSRDFSDVFLIKAYNKDNEIIEISKIYDINGAGRTIQVSFVDKKPDVRLLEIKFNVSCSGKIELKSWQPL